MQHHIGFVGGSWYNNRVGCQTLREFVGDVRENPGELRGFRCLRRGLKDHG